MATLEAVHRRRMARRGDSLRREQRERREAEAVKKLTARAVRRGTRFTLLHLDYRYHQLRSCGWDVLTTEWAVDLDGKACAPESSCVWAWWVGLHWRERERVRSLSLADKAHQQRERRHKVRSLNACGTGIDARPSHTKN